MDQSPLRTKLKAGNAAHGVWSIMANATTAEIAIKAGLDFCILDMEHGAFDFGSLEQAIRAVEGAGGSPLVRVPDLHAPTFQRVLDLGAHGLVVPQIRNAADAETAIRFASFAPRGSRGYNPFTRAADYAAPKTSDTGKLKAGFPLLCLIVENETAFADLAAICAKPEIDAIYLGVYDMAQALGCNGDVNHPKVKAFVENATKTALAAGKTVGVMARTPDARAAAIASGARLIVGGVDSNIAYEAFRSLAGRS